MKKFFMLTAAVLMCLCFAMPATAKVHMGGLVALDFYYDRHDSDGGQPAGTDDWQQLQIQVAPHSRLNGRWVNDDGNVGMFIELSLAGADLGNGVNLRHAYGWWQITPMFKLIAGQTDLSVGTLNPGQVLGMGSPDFIHIIGIGFGNIYESRLPQLRLETKFNDMITWKIAAVMNRSWDDDGGNAIPGLANGGMLDIAGNEENVWPRVDTMLALNFGPLYIEPGFSWAKAKHDEGSRNVGAATSFNIFAAILGARFAMGPFSAAAEGFWGQNLASASGFAVFTTAAASPWWDFEGPEYNEFWDITDAEDVGFWVDLGFKVGPATIHAIYGYQQTTAHMTWWSFNDATWLDGEAQWARQMLGLSVPITVARIFIIRPEIFYYDYNRMDLPDDFNRDAEDTLNALAPVGDNIEIQDFSRGHEIVGGVSFTVVF